MGIYDDLLTLSHYLQVALDRDMEKRLVQLSFSAAFDWVSHRGLLYQLRSVSDGGQFLFTVSEVFLAIKGSGCVWVIRSVRQLMWFRECPR